MSQKCRAMIPAQAPETRQSKILFKFFRTVASAGGNSMRKLREWINRKKRAKRFKMYKLEPVSNVIRIQPDIQVISVTR